MKLTAPLPSRQDTPDNGLFKAATNTPPERLPSDRCPTLRLDRARLRFLFVHALAPRTLSNDARLLFLSRKSRAAALPCASLARLAAHLDCAGKMLLTDLCNRHSIRAPENRSTPEPTACAVATTSAMRPEREPRAIRIAASDHLAAIRPQVEQRLTARLQLRTGHLRPSIHLSRRRRAPLESGASLPRRSRPRTRLVIRPLTPPVAPRVRPLKGVR